MSLKDENLFAKIVFEYKNNIISYSNFLLNDGFVYQFIQQMYKFIELFN